MRRIDRFTLILTAILILGGLFIFLSASLGLLTRGDELLWKSAAIQVFLGALGGTIIMLLLSRLDYKKLKKYAPYLFGLGLITTALVFVPGVGATFGGATRWLLIGPLTLQPAELLKLATIIFLAMLFAQGARERKSSWWMFGTLVCVLAAASALLLLQPDTGTVLILAMAAYAMFYASGVSWKVVLVSILLPMLVLGSLAMMRPYIKERVLTYLNPAADPLGSGYQIQQSFIAIGSGGLWGRGFGQSVQKFNYLPEPTSDSIFAVYAEEFGFLGALLLIFAFLLFGIRGLQIARRAPDRFGGLLAIGVVILLVAQAFTNMGAMLGVLPLTGLPLTFVSHGGSALLFSLAGVGLLLSVSRYQKRT